MFNSVGSFLGMIPGIVILRMFYFTFNLSFKADLGSAGEQPNRNNMTDWNSIGALICPHFYPTILVKIPPKTLPNISQHLKILISPRIRKIS